MLKLYVWENVLVDYTSGLVCILAHNEREAWDLLYEKDDTAWWVLQGCPRIEIKNKSYSSSAYENVPETGYFRTAARPEVITEPRAFVVWGGG